MIKELAVLGMLPFILVGTGEGNVVTKIDTNQEVSIQKENGLETNMKQNQKIAIQFKEGTEIKKNGAGAPLLSIDYKLPVVKLHGNEAASKKIDAYYEGVKEIFESHAKELLGYAEEDYNVRPKEDLQYWNGYATSMKYTPARTDEKVISLVRNYYEFTGGAHPNSTKLAENFSPVTGEKLTLKDVVKDEATATKAISVAILKQIQAADYKDYLFEGYEKDIPSLLEEGTWYFSDEGFVVIGNEYIIGPHALGILEFTIPYKEATFLKDAYLK